MRPRIVEIRDSSWRLICLVQDRKRHDALQQVFDVTGGWARGLGSANTVVEALKRAIPLFEH